jgi:hypothetical protein
MSVAFGWLGLRPSDFWEMTPREFCCGLQGWREVRGDHALGLAPEERESLQAFLAETPNDLQRSARRTGPRTGGSS